MGVVDAFISEGTTNLENLVLPADDQTLEVQLRCYPESNGHIGHLVCDSFKRSCNCSSSIHIEHWGFYLQKPGLYERRPYVIVDQRAKSEGIGGLVARERVNVRSSSKCFSIVNFVRNVMKTGRKNLGDFQGEDGQLT